MTKTEWKVKDIIKYLADFNPNAIIGHSIDFSWVNYTGDDVAGERDIEKEKAEADFVFLVPDGSCEK